MKCLKYILESGANIVFTSNKNQKTISKELQLKGVQNVHFFGNLSKEQLQRISVATGAKIFTDLSQLQSEIESGESFLGTSDSLEVQELSGKYLITLRGIPHNYCSVILRGPTLQIIEEAQRVPYQSL
jgi:chaperonin GroEL (HSP60 family)